MKRNCRSAFVRSHAFVIHRASSTSPRSTLILVVEDDPLQRFGMIDLVEDAGFAAIEARDANQAVEILENRLDVRVVFTDIDMPGSMDGLKLAAAIRKRWPPIEIIVTSGRHRSTIEELPARAPRFFPSPWFRWTPSASSSHLPGDPLRPSISKPGSHARCHDGCRTSEVHKPSNGPVAERVSA